MTEEVGSSEGTTTETTTQSTTETTTQSTTETTQQAAPWYDGWAPESIGLLQNRGLDKGDAVAAARNLADGYRSLQGNLGVPAERLLKLPENLTDSEAMASIYDRLGRPAKAEDYQFVVPDGIEKDAEFENAMKTTFHGLGLSAAQGSQVVEAYNKYMVDAMTAAAKEVETTNQEAALRLQKEWGQAYDQNTRVAKAGAAGLGISEDQLTEVMDALDETIGHDVAMQMFYKIGASMQEDAMRMGGGGGSNDMNFVKTPEQAKLEISELQNDAEFRKKLRAGDVDSTRRWNLLHAQATPPQPNQFKVGA